MEEEDSNAPSTETASPNESETDVRRAAGRTKITEPKEEERHSSKHRSKETKERSSRSSKSASSERKRSKSRKRDDDEAEGYDIWNSDEDVPEHIKNLRNFTEKPTTPEEKKKSIKKKKSGTSQVAIQNEKASHYKAVVLDTQPVDLSSFGLPHDTADQSMTKISIRRKSITKDKESAASNVYMSKSRLKFTEEKPPPPKPVRNSPPLVIPSAYAQVFTREYGSKIPTLQEFQATEDKKKTTAKERSRKSTSSVEDRYSKKSEGKKSESKKSESRKSESKKSGSKKSESKKTDSDESVSKKSESDDSVSKKSESDESESSITSERAKTKKLTSKVSYKEDEEEKDNDEDEDDDEKSSSRSSKKSLDESIEDIKEQHGKNKVLSEENRKMSHRRSARQ